MTPAHRPTPGRLLLRSLIMLGLLAVATASPASDDGENAKAALTGTVVAPDGSPVAGARVWTGDVGGETVEARTDADGRFRLGPLTPAFRPGQDVYVDAEGFARQYAWAVGLSRFPGVVQDLGTIRLDRGVVFTGQVLDAEGAPLEGISLDGMFILGRRLLRGEQGWTAETDAEGRFRTPPLPVGRGGVSVMVPGYRRNGAYAQIAPGAEGGAFDPIRLERDTPYTGTVVDEQGEPIAGATVSTYASSPKIRTDASGSFTLRNLHPAPWFPIGVRKEGFVPVVNRPVYPSEAGFSWFEEGPDGEPVRSGPFAELTVTLQRVEWIEGRVVDAETGEPVTLSSVVLCSVSRNEDGEPVLTGCRTPDFQQPAPGRFRLAYVLPREFHLTLSAEGYHDAEAFLPPVDTLRPIGGITVELTPKDQVPAAVVPTQQIVGLATRDGRPIETGWAALARLRGPQTQANANTQRGRLVPWPISASSSVPIRDGAFELDVRYQDDDWYVLVEEPGHAPTVVGPVSVALGERKRLDVSGVGGGSIAGRVVDVSEAQRGMLWVVAFSETGTLAEARVGDDGTFRLTDLPPGRYGLKVGHDAFEDAEAPQTNADSPRSIFERLADPWNRAEAVTVEPGESIADVVLTAPETPDRLDPSPGAATPLP